ncbi:MAG: hypothetical protein ACRCWR_06405, partial [Saezia sp.]
AKGLPLSRASSSARRLNSGVYCCLYFMSLLPFLDLKTREMVFQGQITLPLQQIPFLILCHDADKQAIENAGNNRLLYAYLPPSNPQDNEPLCLR